MNSQILENSFNDKISDVLTCGMDNLNAYVLICNSHYNVVYENQLWQGFNNGNDSTGKKCFTALHNRSTPCDKCPIKKFEANPDLDSFLFDIEYNKKKIESRVSRFKVNNNAYIMQVMYEVTGIKKRLKESKINENNFHESEKKLRQSLNFSRQIIDASPIGITVYDDKGQCIVANTSMAKIVGATIDQVTKQNFHKISSWRASGLYDKAILAKREKVVQHHDVTLTSTFGKKLFIQAIFVPFDDDQLLFMLNDLTDFFSTKKKLEEQMEQFQVIFENASDAIFWADSLSGKIVNCNKMAEVLLEREKQEIIGLSQAQLHPPDKAAFYARKFKEHLEKKTVMDDYVEIVTKSGAIKHAEITAAVVQIGEQPIIQGIFRDVSAKYAAEKKLEETTAQLIQAEKLTALGEMTASINHEIQQPLNVIELISQKMLRKLKKNILDQEILQKNFSDISSQIKKMTQIIDHMRSYSRKTDFHEYEAVSVSDLIQKSLIFFQQEFKNCDINIILRIDNDLPVIKCNQIQLEQVITNLVNNARHALESSDKPEKVIEIGAFVENNQNVSQVVIFVKDNGVGIPDSIVPIIYEPFFTTKSKNKGTGLGLHVVKKIITEHNGRIAFETCENKGTKFIIYMPVYKD